MKKHASLIIILLISILPLGAYSNNAVIFSIDDSVYSDMDALYAEASLVRASTARPWSAAEVRMMLERVDVSSLSEYGRLLYDRIEEKTENALRWNWGDDLGLNVTLDTTVEAYAHTNGDDFDTEEDWVRGYDERKSLFKLTLAFSTGENFYTTADIHYRHNRVDRQDTFTQYSSTSSDGRLSSDGYVGSYRLEGEGTGALYYISHSKFFSDSFTTNVFFDTTHYSFIWPRRAVFSFGGENWNFSANRDRLSLGNAGFSNLLVDNHTFSDYSRLTFFSSLFKYDAVFLFLNSIVKPGEPMNSESRIYMIHSLNFRILDRITFTLSENVMYKYTTLDLSYFNPSFIYHNLNNRSMFNALAYIDFNILVMKGLEFYFQLAVDQARAPNEDDSQTGSYGILAGVSHTQSLKGGNLSLFAEYVMTSPLLYRRDGVDFIRNTRYNAVDGTAYFINCFDYIGFVYGGDCRMMELSAKYTSPSWWTVSLFMRFVEKGEVNLYRSHNSEGMNSGMANLRGSTPWGENISYCGVVGLVLNGDLESFLSFPGISFGINLDWVGRLTKAKSTGQISDMENDFELTLSLTISV